MMRIVPVVFALCAGCKVVDAPDELEQLVVFGFTNFEGEPELPAAAAEGMIPYAQTNADELEEGYRVNNLTNEDLVAAGVVTDDEIDIMGASAVTRMVSTVDDIAWVLTYPDMTEVQDQTIAYEISEQTDRDCFLAHECEMFELTATRTTDTGAFGDSIQTFTKAWRWVELEELGTVLTQRELAPEPAEMTSTVIELDQQYGYSIMFSGEAGTERLETLWVDARLIGIEVPDTFALDIAVNKMQGNAENLDTFIAENR